VGCSPCSGPAPLSPYGPAAYGVERGGGGFEACASRFRTFDPATGTYISYTGVRLLCPYLGY
jgi:hypothetical protein